MSVYTYHSRREYAKSIASTAGLAYKEDRDCKVPQATATTITVPPYRMDFTEDEETAWWHGLIHETYHHQFPADFEFLKKQKWKSQSLLSDINNLVCDHHIEHDKHGEYEGRDKWMGKGRNIITKSIIDKVRDTPLDNDAGRKRIAACAYDLIIRQSWDKYLRGLDFDSVIDNETSELIDKLLADETLAVDYFNAHTPEEVYEVAKRVVNILEDDENAAEQQEQQMQEGKGEDGGEGDGEPGDAEKFRVDFNDIDWSHDPDKPHNPFASSKIDYTSVRKGVDFQVREVDVRDYTKEKDTSGGWGDHYAYAETFANLPDDNELSQKVKRYLLVKSRKKKEIGKRTGRVHRKSAWKVGVLKGTPDAQRIFKQKRTTNTLDVAVSLVVDHSGSMGGSKYVNAAYSAMLLSDVLQKIGVAHEIVGFSYRGGPIHIIHKHYDKPVSRGELKDSFAAAGNLLMDNSDGEAILWCGNRLIGRKEKKKVMIVLSDGQPAAGGYGVYGFTKEMVRAWEKRVDLYGIGIEDNSVEHFYKHNSVINSSDELEEKLLKVMQERIIGE